MVNAAAATDVPNTRKCDRQHAGTASQPPASVLVGAGTALVAVWLDVAAIGHSSPAIRWLLVCGTRMFTRAADWSVTSASSHGASVW